jgi:hypothetical protein
MFDVTFTNDLGNPVVIGMLALVDITSVLAIIDTLN